MDSLSDLLNQAGSGGFNPLAFLFQGQQPAQAPQAGIPQPAPVDPTGAASLPAAAPGNVLARLQSAGATVPTPPPVTTPHIFSGLPDVKGMSRGAAFASGLAGGLGDASKQALLAQNAQTQNFQNNLALYKTLFEQKNTEASQAEQAKRDQTLASYYEAQTNPELQGKLTKAKAEAAEPDEVASAAERQKILASIDTARGDPEGTYMNTPAGAQFVASGKFPIVPASSIPVDPTLTPEAIEERAGRAVQGDQSAYTGLGYGGRGAANRTAVANREASMIAEQGGTATDVVRNIVGLSGEKAGARTMGQMGARISTFAEEAKGTAAEALDASSDLPREAWVPIEKIIQMGQSATNNPKYVRLLAANNGIANTYSKAINPQGVLTDEGKRQAFEILNVARSNDGYAAGVKQLMREASIVQDAISKSRATQLYGGVATPSVPALPPSPATAAPQVTEPPPGAPPGTRKAPDGKFYAPDPSRPGKYLQVNP